MAVLKQSLEKQREFYADFQMIKRLRRCNSFDSKPSLEEMLGLKSATRTSFSPAVTRSKNNRDIFPTQKKTTKRKKKRQNSDQVISSHEQVSGKNQDIEIAVREPNTQKSSSNVGIDMAAYEEVIEEIDEIEEMEESVEELLDTNDENTKQVTQQFYDEAYGPIQDEMEEEEEE